MSTTFVTAYLKIYDEEYDDTRKFENRLKNTRFSGNMYDKKNYNDRVRAVNPNVKSMAPSATRPLDFTSVMPAA